MASRSPIIAKRSHLIPIVFYNEGTGSAKTLAWCSGRERRSIVRMVNHNTTMTRRMLATSDNVNAARPSGPPIEVRG